MAALIVFIFTWWLILQILEPGNVVWPVENADSAITKVKATHIGIFGLISFALFKLCGKKKEEKKEVEAAEEVSAEAEVDELINSIE